MYRDYKFFLQKPSKIWVEACEETSGIAWHFDTIQQLIQEHQPSAYLFWELLKGIYMRKERKELSLMKLSAKERYKRFLKEYPGVDQRLPQYQIASYLGVTPETLSRLRKDINC